MKMLGDNNTTERKLYTQIYKWSFSIWHVKKILKISFGKWIISIYYACFSDCNDNEVLLFGKYSVLNTKYCACYIDCKGWRLFFGCFFLMLLSFRGLFLSINDRGHLYEMICNWPEIDVKARTNLSSIHKMILFIHMCLHHCLTD